MVNMFVSLAEHLTEKVCSHNIKAIEKSMTFGNIGKVNDFEIVKTELIELFRIFQALFFNCARSDSFLTTNGSPSVLLKLFATIIADIERHEDLYVELLKTLHNALFKNDLVKGAFLLNANGNTSLFATFTDKFCGSLATNKLKVTFDLESSLLKSLLQSKQVLKIAIRERFVDKIFDFLNKTTANSKLYNAGYIQKQISECVGLLSAMTFEMDNLKKLINVEVIRNILEIVTKIQSNEVVYDILLFVRNASFMNKTKLFLKFKDNLLGTLFSLLSAEKTPLKVRVVISNILWVVLYNNQNVEI